MNMICTIESCEKDAWAKGLCPMHLRRLRVHGDPNYTTRIPNGEKLKWLKSSLPHETDECIIWPFKVGNHGYGTLNYDKAYMLAHHVVLALHNRSLPINDLEETRHLCNNKKCVNNRHLVVGPHIDNAADRERAGIVARGMKNGQAKLTDDQVRQIKERPNYWGINAVLAKEFNVSASLIGFIRQNKRWTHI